MNLAITALVLVGGLIAFRMLFRFANRIVCTLAFVAGALVVGCGVFAYQYAGQWTPMQRTFWPVYLRTLVKFPEQATFKVLTVGAAVATQQDVDAGRKVEWKTERLLVAGWHELLRTAVYEGRSVSDILSDAWWWGFAPALGLALAWGVRKDIARARQRRAGHVALRGTNLVSRSEYHRATRGNDGVGWLTEAGPTPWERVSLPRSGQRLVRIAKRDEQEHILCLGDSGSGKSSLLRRLLRQLADRGDAVLCYDPKCEFVGEFLEPSRGDVVFNPMDERMPYYSPAEDDLLHEHEALALAVSLFPPRANDPNPFFARTAGEIFAYLLKQRLTPWEMYERMRKADPELDRLLAETELAPHISKTAGPQRSGVLSSIAKAAAAMKILPRHADTRWSPTGWVQNGCKPWVFITSTPSTREVLKPLISMLLDIVILRLLGRSEELRQRPVWIVIEELASLQHLPNLHLGLAEARSSNTRLVLSLQGRGQLEYEYGLLASVMLSQPKTRFFLRTAEAASAKWVSDCLGQIEAEKLHEGQQVGELGFMQHRNVSRDRRIEPAVFSSEVGHLPDLEGYFSTPGFTLRAKFPYCVPIKRQPAFIPRPEASALPEPVAVKPAAVAFEPARKKFEVC